MKGIITFDAREQTEYGTLRSYATLGISTSNANGTNARSLRTTSNRWFIQWAGFTIGHASSFYDFYNTGANQYGSLGALSDSTDGGWDVFGYTAQLGNGLSASIAAEVQRRSQIILAGQCGRWRLPVRAARRLVSLGLGSRASRLLRHELSGHDCPDLVANLRVDQAWGSAQIMGAIHQVNASYTRCRRRHGGTAGRQDWLRGRCAASRS